MKTQILGDTHLGRTFINGVPLHRRGEREAMQWDQFVKALNPEQGTELHVHLGDLFDKAVVSYDLILNTAYAYIEAATANPNCIFVVLKGNHDYIRDLTKRSAFDVFEALVEGHDNIVVVKDKAIKIGEQAFIGYSVKLSASDLLVGCHTLYGHYDVESFGGDDHNLVPTKRAAELGIKKIVTGHIHKPDSFVRDGVEVVVHGSMQPFAHGEEINDDLYVTLTLEQLAEADPIYLHKRCVRVLGVPDHEVDCLQLTIKRSKELDADDTTVELGDFSMDDLFAEVFSEQQVSKELQDRITSEYQSRRVID